eukprot:TRINITY_DN19526_c0_g1_i4.p1 TRINITY_DN19526_c0_g1~~TRINITY_DN19526_c0_g1_i4.p1  ORF type:complete len:391 (+),score=72.41 TRINITY_DN19526_c0_g1_i4:156-1328(+)
MPVDFKMNSVAMHGYATAPLAPFSPISTNDFSLQNDPTVISQYVSNTQNDYANSLALYNQASGVLFPSQHTNYVSNQQMMSGMLPANTAPYKTNSFASTPTTYMSNFGSKSDVVPAMYGGYPTSVSIPLPPHQQQLLQLSNRYSGLINLGAKLPLINMNGVKMVNNPKRAKQLEQLTANKDRTIYVSEIDHNVTEEDLAHLFSRCGDVVDCRLCGDAHSRMRFAFIEFSMDSWRTAIPEALKLNDTIMCGFPIRVLRSKSAIIPVKRELLPRSQTEMERCQRTIYASNIDRRLTEKDVINFFEALSVDEKSGADGKISKVRLLADGSHNTSIAFIEFFGPESAIAALNKCQGALMGCLPLRVSPSKTPVRTQEEERALRNGQAQVTTRCL